MSAPTASDQLLDLEAEESGFRSALYAMDLDIQLCCCLCTTCCNT